MPDRKPNGQFASGNNVKGGRPKRADEQVLVDLWNDHGKAIFQAKVKEGKEWAIKKLLDKIFSDKKEISGLENMAILIKLEKKTAKILSSLNVSQPNNNRPGQKQIQR